jgi:hypothetical protein
MAGPRPHHPTWQWSKDYLSLWRPLKLQRRDLKLLFQDPATTVAERSFAVVPDGARLLTVGGGDDAALKGTKPSLGRRMLVISRPGAVRFAAVLGSAGHPNGLEITVAEDDRFAVTAHEVQGRSNVVHARVIRAP